MKSLPILVGVILSAILPAPAQPLSSPAILDRQHVDLRAVYSPGVSGALSLVVRDGDAAVTHASNEAVLVVDESARLTLPDGTPFGQGGDPIWILPQNQDTGLLFLGVSAEGISNGTFVDNQLRLQLVSVNGPGDFFAWQASPGVLDVKMNSRDGIADADRLPMLAMSHGHLNWGFSAPGAYCITFIVSGTRVGESTPIISEPATFRFHVRPLAPFEQWQFENWPFAACDLISHPGADPDGDSIANLLEYALGLDPNLPGTDGLPRFVWATDDGGRYGALTFTRVKAATDIDYAVRASDAVSGGLWGPLEEVVSVVDMDDKEEVTIRDNAPSGTKGERFLRLEVRLKNPGGTP